jgi:hypothetical protein
MGYYRETKVLFTNLGRETTEESKPEMHKCKCKILIEKIAQEFAHSEIGPPPMNKEKPLEISKLCKGIVTG